MTITPAGMSAVHALKEPAGRTARFDAGRLVAVFPLHDRVKFDAADGSVQHGVIVERLPDDIYLIRCDDHHSRVVHADAIWPF
jgi:hypothetical protein